MKLVSSKIDVITEWIPTPSKLVTLIIIAFMFVLEILLIYFIPYIASDKVYLPLSESLYMRFGGMNWPKTVIFLVIQIFAMCLSIGLYYFFPNIWVFLLVLVIFSGVSIFMCAFAPKHAALDLVDYGSTIVPNPPSSSPYIYFVGLGDIQIFGNSEYTDRVSSTKLAISNIHTYMNSKKEGSTELMGLITPGDCTQTGQDGRWFTHNEVGYYETNYGLGGNSTLKLPVYECTGNHDYDSVESNKFLYPTVPPLVDLINRKNKHRHIESQDGKGNYRWKWSDLHFIAINVWPSNAKLMSGVPDGSLDFLRRSMSEIPVNEKYIILTHYIDDLAEPSILIDALKGRVADLITLIIGHDHTTNVYDQKFAISGIRVIKMPCPVFGKKYEGNFALFQYNKNTKELIVKDVYNSGELIKEPRKGSYNF